MSGVAAGFVVRPVRSAAANVAMSYNPDTGEITSNPSSKRYKADIAPVNDDASATVWRLQPVSFRVTADGPDGPRQYGFIAEDVAEVDPLLAVWSVDGDGRLRPESVLYDRVPVLLLQEARKLKDRLDAAEQLLREQGERLAALERAAA